jgi:hypothetical protein
MLKKKIWVNFQRIIFFTRKIVTKLSKIWVWDLGSGIRGQKGSGSATLVPGTSTVLKMIILMLKLKLNEDFLLLTFVVSVLVSPTWSASSNSFSLPAKFLLTRRLAPRPPPPAFLGAAFLPPIMGLRGAAAAF